MELLKRFTSSLLILSLLAFVPMSCSEDDEDPGAAPEIPPLESMAMDFSDFNNGSTAGRIEEAKTNWGVAAVNVAVWNTILTLNLALPVASFGNAITQEPSFDFDRRLWVWTYDYNFVGRTYSSELTASVSTSTVVWEMNMSEENGFQDVTWFTGEMAIDGSSGYWLLNYDAEDPSPKLRVDWEKTGEDIGVITYTNVIEGDANEGGYITYERTDNADFDTKYDISLPTRTSDINIEWNRSTGNGRIMDAVFFQDEEWHCWDDTFEDADCE